MSDTSTNETLVLDLAENETVQSTNAWYVTELSGQKAYLVNVPGRGVLDLAPGAKPGDGEHIDAWSRSRGKRLIDFDPWSRRAVVATLPRETERVREVIAHALNCRPWEVEISVIDDGGGERTIIIWRALAITREKRKDRWLAIAADLYAHDIDSLWRWSEAWVDGGNRTILTYSADPLAETMPYPADAPVSLTSIPFGIAEDGTEVRYALYESSHF